MAWTNIPNSDLDPESPITTSLVTALRDNPPAIAAGDAGAPKIQLAAMDTDSVGAAQIKADAVGASEIAANAVGASEIAADAVGVSEIAATAVHRSELYTGVVSLSGGLSSLTTTDVVFGYAYVFFPMLHALDGDSNRSSLMADDTDGVNPDSPRISIQNTSGSVGSYDIDFRYVRA